MQVWKGVSRMNQFIKEGISDIFTPKLTFEAYQS